MPELPEVETTLRGIAPHLQGEVVSDIIIRNASLRWPIPKDLSKLLRGHTVRSLHRRAKYILVAFDHGTLILHLGMSGSLRILPHGTPPEKHDHFDLVLGNSELMRLRDPRRFGAVLWHEGDVAEHALLSHLGPEPLTPDLLLPPRRGKVGMGVESRNTNVSTPSLALPLHGGVDVVFDTNYLYQALRKRSAPIKLAIMDSQLVVGVGNIYANEALFRAGIKPQLAANKVSRARCERLVQTIKEVLREAIEQGGSSLRDFIHSDGSSGYFQQHYFVYGRKDEACKHCPQCQK
ncbi:MAG: formamidopyrimidine-DNA glycosylase [Gallionellaceae bacterium]|nr:MAG: formamidopyrimidine-DNA glycosylase [Gallionellaceae bacterium]